MVKLSLEVVLSPFLKIFLQIFFESLSDKISPSFAYMITYAELLVRYAGLPLHGLCNRVGEALPPTCAPGTRQLLLTFFLWVPVCIKREPGKNPGSRPPTVLRRKPARGRSHR